MTTDDLHEKDVDAGAGQPALALEPEPADMQPPGLCTERLAALPPGTILDEAELARIFNCSRATIKRAVQRGELPAPCRMFGRPVLTAGRILEHVAARLAAAQREAEKENARIARLTT